MAYTTINKSSLQFNTKLFTGNGADATAYTGVGFQPDLTWIKRRNGTNFHVWTDAVRGATKQIYSNSDSVEQTVSSGLQSFNADGFTLGTNTDTNGSGGTYASWNWKANGQGSSNTAGSINTTYTSANTTAGFSIIKYTGNGVAGATIGHGLGAVPKTLIVKQTNSANNWKVYHVTMGNGKIMNLNDNSAENTNTAFWNDTSPTDTLITLGTNGAINGNGDTYIMYVFAEKTGYSKFGSYAGNNNSEGPFVYCGFKPALVMIKYTGSSQNWIVVDNKRPGYNLISAGDSQNIRVNSTSAEVTSNGIDLLSNGFKLRSSDGDSNGYSNPYIYLAFGQTLVGSNNVPATAR